jgi:uncharacterized protein GlcG (DUF336 family)
MTTVSLADARRCITAGERRAQELGLPMNIAVVDHGGDLVSHVRMDGAWIGSVDVSINRAFTADQLHQLRPPASALAASGRGAARPGDVGEPGDRSNHRGQDDDPGRDPGRDPDPGRGSDPGRGRGPARLFPGGIPLIRDGVVVGAVGVSGGTGVEDQAVAEAAARSF